ncbi:MAG: ribosome recycling factor [candidate division WOR-3 bacterium]|nr:ribosome recycling factor [candidate division WOR-3 bacterium]
MLEEIYKTARNKMQKTYELLSQEFARIRTGRANPAILDGIKVDYYGNPTPLKQLANIYAPEPRMLIIQVWDKNVVAEIEKAIYKAELGITPKIEGSLIKIPIPPLTEERRKELIKLCAKLSEDAKVAIRNIRRDANEEIKKLEKDKKISEDDSRIGTKKIQEITDEFTEKIEELFKKKEKEILEE